MTMWHWSYLYEVTSLSLLLGVTETPDQPSEHTLLLGCRVEAEPIAPQAEPALTKFQCS